MVSVLVFVDQDMPEASPILLPKVQGTPTTNAPSVWSLSELIKIQRIRPRYQSPLIFPVRLGVALLQRRAGAGHRPKLMIDQLVLLQCNTGTMIARTGKRFGSRSNTSGEPPAASAASSRHDLVDREHPQDMLNRPISARRIGERGRVERGVGLSGWRRGFRLNPSPYHTYPAPALLVKVMARIEPGCARAAP